ncbi:MAG: STAS domain-containing protein [Planctomycetaceae bacterium]|nr:STAS domain-containing protein [Planctomycetaceae bacterium]
MEFIERGGVLRVLFDTRLDSLVCNIIEQDLAQRISDAKLCNPNVVVEFDLTQAEFVCSTFLRFCVIYAKQMGKGNFHIANLSPNVLHVFEISGLLGVIDLVTPGGQVDMKA